MTNYYYKRIIDSELNAWKEEKKRKPLLLRGARQVGKSSSVHKLAEKFEFFVEINFEKNRHIYRFFEGDFDVKEICTKLSVQFQKPIIPNKTLLFFPAKLTLEAYEYVATSGDFLNIAKNRKNVR